MPNILNRLKIWQKLFIGGLAFGVPLVLTTYLLLQEKSIKIAFAQAELRGDAYLRPCAKLLEHVSRHKTLARRLLRGDTSLKPKLDEAASQVDAAFAELVSVDRELMGPLATDLDSLRRRGRESSLPSAMQKAWQALKAGSADVPASDAAHLQLVGAVRNLITHVGDSSKLILDPDLDSYYQMDALLLREPELVDRLSQLGDRVEDDLLGKAALSLQERTELAAALALLQFHGENVDVDAKTTINETPNFNNYAAAEKDLLPPLGRLTSKLKALVELTRAKVIEPQALTAGVPEYAEAVAGALQASSEYWTVLLDGQDTMLQIRMQGDLQRRRVALWSVLAAVALTTLLTFLILRSITVPIAKAVGVAERLARGELPEKVEVGSATDETAVLLRAINDMLQFLDLKRTIATLQETTQMLTNAVADLESQTSEHEQMTTRQSAAVQETQVTGQEIKQTSRLAAEKAAAVLQVAERADAVGREGEEAMEKTVGGLQDIRAQAQEIAQKISELNQRTQQIVVITQTVKDLADQSNMLALNAAIEAVRSGEHGKGFAVVAREIRSLADQSIQATNRVNEILQSITTSMQETVAIAEGGRQRMEAGLLEVKASSESLRQLSNMVRDSSQGVRQIAAAVSQQDAGISQIFGAVLEQSKLMDETVKRVEGSRLSVATVRSASAKVAEVVGRFRA